MGYRFDDRSVSSTTELLEVLKKDHEIFRTDSLTDGESKIWYRGLPSTDMCLLPTLHRIGIPVAEEGYLMNKFKQNAYEFLDERPQGEWEWMLLARHHGLPSRLLDWTENPLVGLFFACNGDNEDYIESDGALWCLSPSKLNEVANIGDGLPMFLDENILSPPDESLGVYKTQRLANITGDVERPPAAAISIRTNKRIQAQLGVFTIHHASKKPLEEWGDRSHLWKLIIPKTSKLAIRDELRRLGITGLTLFPDLDHVAREAGGS